MSEPAKRPELTCTLIAEVGTRVQAFDDLDVSENAVGFFAAREKLVGVARFLVSWDSSLELIRGRILVDEFAPLTPSTIPCFHKRPTIPRGARRMQTLTACTVAATLRRLRIETSLLLDGHFGPNTILDCRIYLRHALERLRRWS